MFLSGFEIFTLISLASGNGLLSKSLIFTIRVFTPLENGEIYTSYFALSENSTVLKSYVTTVASAF